MTKLAFDFSMDVSPNEAMLACQNAVASLGWRIKSSGPDEIKVLGPVKNGYETLQIGVQFAATGQDSTAITLNGWSLLAAGPLAKKKLGRDMHELQEAMSANLGGTYLRDCILLGGHGHEIGQGARCSVVFRTDRLLIEPAEGASAVLDYKDVELVEIGGKGLVKSGGGFIGGGFGAEGALLGIGVSSALNSLTTSTGIDTVIHIKGGDCEAWLRYPHETPDALRMRLGAVMAEIEVVRREQAQAQLQGQRSVADELERIHDLHSRGVLTDEEYSAAKMRLIDRL